MPNIGRFIIPGLLVFSGMCGFQWTVISIYEYFGVGSGWFKASGWLGEYFIFMNSFVVGASVSFWRWHTYCLQLIMPTAGHEKVPVYDYIDVLKTRLEDWLREDKIEEVLKVGIDASLPFLSSSDYSTRIVIAELIEEAASRSSMRELQVRLLVDAIGWPRVEKGEFKRAEEQITHGLKLAGEIDDYYYVTKANRHLGAIYVRQGKFEEANKFFDEAKRSAVKIENLDDRVRMEGELHYAYAFLEHKKANHEECLRYLEKYEKLFSGKKNKIWEVKILCLRADCLLEKGDFFGAKDLYRKGLQKAKSHKLYKHIVKNEIGLAKIYISDNKIASATEFLESAKQVAEDIDMFLEKTEINRLLVALPDSEV